MERTIDVTITVSDDDGSAEVYFYDNQSGDHRSIEVGELDEDIAIRIGREITDWIDIMRENMKED